MFVKKYVFELKSCDFILHFLFIQVLAALHLKKLRNEQSPDFGAALVEDQCIFNSRVTDNVMKPLESDETKSEIPE